jgi:DNA-binding response OmpR family regulator
MTQKDKILVVSHNPQLAVKRRRILESAGFEVLAVNDSRAVGTTCVEHKVRLAVVGYSLLPADKRRIWAEIRQHCDIPVLELHKKSKPELMAPAFFFECPISDDLLEDVMPVLERLH